APHVRVEAAELLLHLEKAPRVRDRRLDLLPIADQARIGEQPLDRTAVEAGDARGIEAGECAPIALALAEHRAPAQSGLCRLEDQKLEVRVVVMDRHAPLSIVVVEVLLVDAFAPWAAHDVRHRGSAIARVLRPLAPVQARAVSIVCRRNASEKNDSVSSFADAA